MAQGTQKTILIIEDEITYRRILREKLTNEGFTILETDNGESGLAIALNKKPNLILLDLDIPKMDGMTVLSKLRVHGDWGKNVPVFILTSLPSADEERMQDVTKLVPTYYLEKSSIDMEDLVEKIRKS
jgi:DNA-binding response OmpR family regulator